MASIIDIDEYKIEKASTELFKKIQPLAERIVQLQSEMKELGMFANHRCLAECSRCQLFEDVTGKGMLIVTHGADYRVDTGLRFEELDKISGMDNAVKCPSCQSIFCPIDKEYFYTFDD
ncbi:MAG: hypothetical protein CMF50_04230 [Legionellales bacterium]|nr:hypothetical protein [Legionellales bacterium]|tara:strand:+ start:1254 stop:1610 length:357 start_codon:yes stop_codon:yes gene_type:complete